jgi:hypothetical protein
MIASAKNFEFVKQNGISTRFEATMNKNMQAWNPNSVKRRSQQVNFGTIGAGCNLRYLRASGSQCFSEENHTIQ